MILDSTGLFWLQEKLMMFLLLTEMIGKIKLLEKDMLLKKLPIISARKVAAAMPCTLKVSQTSMRGSTELLLVFKKAKV